MEWQWWPLLAAGGWAAFRLLGEWYCRGAAKRWFGSPEPGSIRLFGRGQRRPIQSFKSLHVPTVGIFDYAKKRRKLESGLQRNRIEWGALGDGLAVGAGAYAAAIASSAQAHSNLLALPSSLDKVDVGATQAASLSSAQQVGYDNWLQGHIGESVAANVLTAQGHHVAFAAIPNQPGWDLMVDGVPMNVKVGESAVANIGDHFEKYPNIEVVTDTHTAAVLDHPLVHGLPGLEPDHIQALAHTGDFGGAWGDHSAPLLDGHWDGLHGAHAAGAHGFTDGAAHHLDAHGGVDGAGPDLHIPWITVGLGVFREFGLADKYGGSFGESIVAIAADAAGVAVGAKVGALAGAILGPVGMIGGAILGAIVGKGAVNAVRQSNVEAEVQRLKPKLEAIDTAWKREAEAFAAEAKQVVDRANKQLNEETESTRITYGRKVEALGLQHDQATIVFFKTIHQTFDRFDEWLNQDLLSIRRKFHERPKWIQFLLPSKAESARQLAESWLSAKRVELEAWRDRFGNISAAEELSGEFDISAARELLMEFVGTYKVWDEDAAPVLKESLDRFESISTQAAEAHKRAMKSIVKKLRSCESSAQAEIEGLWADHERALVELAKGVDGEIRDLARRAARAHLTSFHPPLELVQMRSDAVRTGIKQNTSGADRLAVLPALAGN